MSQQNLTRDKAFFVRMNEKEMQLVEAAVKIRYGEVHEMKSAFARQVLLSAAKRILKDAAEKRRGV